MVMKVLEKKDDKENWECWRGGAVAVFCIRQTHQKERKKHPGVGTGTLAAGSTLEGMDLVKTLHRPGSGLRAIWAVNSSIPRT